MRIVRMLVGVLAVLLGGWMTFDGARALVIGDYVTPADGPYAGALGPWAGVVQAVGIAPRATGMKAAFVVLGLAWLAAAFAHLRGGRHARPALTALAAGTLWYLPAGTVLALLVLAGLWTSRPNAAEPRATR